MASLMSSSFSSFIVSLLSKNFPGSGARRVGGHPAPHQAEEIRDEKMVSWLGFLGLSFIISPLLFQFSVSGIQH